MHRTKAAAARLLDPPLVPGSCQRGVLSCSSRRCVMTENPLTPVETAPPRVVYEWTSVRGHRLSQLPPEGTPDRRRWVCECGASSKPGARDWGVKHLEWA